MSAEALAPVTDWSRKTWLLILSAIIASILGAAWLMGDAPAKYTDTAGQEWTCAPLDPGMLDCRGMQERWSSPDRGRVRAFDLGNHRVTFRVERWGHTPDGPARYALETGGQG